MPGSLQSIERAAAVLRLLARHPEDLALHEIAGALELAKGTAHGIVNTLRVVGLVDQDPQSGRYRLGVGLNELASHHLDVNELRSRAVNWADTLAGRSAESVRLGTLSGPQVLVVHHVFRPDDQPQTMDTGTLLPAHASALGLALLAYAPEAAAAYAELPAFTPRTIIDRQVLSARLRMVRAQGWAAERAERLAEHASIAAPIRDPGGLVVGAIGISGHAERLFGSGDVPSAELVELVVTAGRSISRDLSSDRR
ncbi:MAG: putative IclR-family transcriptional regulator [Frankiales bacterium]|jgi:DNA-binding IclR family transcriptional regulator|nr:putative IclR-family transcriptional regulator [Frankiales bacterium]